MHIILHISPCFEMKKTTLLHIYICFTLIVLLLPGCSVNKFIPEGGYLLDDVKIESDNKEIKSSQMNQYVRQSPNAKWFSLFRFPLYIYSASGMDSTKWINRFWRKLGDAPVIYSKDAAQETQQEIVRNMGYMGAVVDLKEEAKGKRMKVSYDIHSGSPYIINNIAYDIADSKIRSYLEADSAQTLLHEGMRFDVNVLDEERQRITQYLQNRGYYRFNKDFITFQADTMLNTHKVDLTMELASFQIRKEDMPEEAERKGLGTPATRAAIIEKLVATGFVERKRAKKAVSLVPAHTGVSLITVLPEQLQSPLLTAEWEYRLQQVERGELSPDEFMTGIADMLTELVKTYQVISGAEVLFPSGREIIGKCPRCGGEVSESKKGFFCEKNDCRFGLWRDNKFFAAKRAALTKKVAAALLAGGRVKLTGLYSEKTGGTYDATAVLEDTGESVRFRLEFDKGART